MNRRLLLQVAAPSLMVGLLLLATCLASVWYTSRLQRDLTRVLSQNVTSLQAAQELEIRVRQLRFHCFLYLMDPRPARLAPIEEDHRNVEQALQAARQAADTPEEQACVNAITAGYRQYREEMADLRAQAGKLAGQRELGKLADAHPVRHVTEPCHQLLTIDRNLMTRTADEAGRVGDQVRLAMLLLGLAGPASGVLMGYGIARGLSRSIYRLSLRVQDMAQHLDQDVASVVVAADGDLRGLDKQLEHVVARVEEVGQRLQRQQRDMLRAEQLAAVGQLAASVAHEVRNPLTSVNLLVESALRTQNRKPLTLDDLKVIHAEIERLEQTVQNFLDFARPPTPQRALADLRAIVTQAVELVRTRARQQGVTIDVHCPDLDVIAAVDRGLLGTVLVNLFINALDAMPQGGRLEIDLEVQPDVGIRLSICDTGSGIADTMNGRLFTPFASTKPTGTGLGLSTCRRIVEEHDGSITASNRPTGGACFTIRLPIPEGAHAPAPGRG